MSTQLGPCDRQLSAARRGSIPRGSRSRLAVRMDMTAGLFLSEPPGFSPLCSVVTRSLAMATRRVSENSSNWLVCYDIKRYLWGRFVCRVVLPIESVFLDRGHVEANGVIWNVRCHLVSGIWYLVSGFVSCLATGLVWL